VVLPVLPPLPRLLKGRPAPRDRVGLHEHTGTPPGLNAVTIIDARAILSIVSAPGEHLQTCSIVESKSRIIKGLTKSDNHSYNLGNLTIRSYIIKKELYNLSLL
jgi:hypothetical protein